MLYSDGIVMPKQKVEQPKKLHNDMEGQSGANLSSTTMSSHLHELKSSGIGDHDATNNPPPVGGELEAGAQESPSISDIELEDDVLPPDKGKEKAVPHDTAQEGSEPDPSTHPRTTYHLQFHYHQVLVLDEQVELSQVSSVILANFHTSVALCSIQFHYHQVLVLDEQVELSPVSSFHL